MLSVRGEMRALCVSIHDVAPATWSRCRELRDAVHKVCPRAPVTLLVVPNYHDGGTDTPPAYLEWLRACVARGDEIALHGYTHRDERARDAHGMQSLARRVYTASEGEFAGLSHQEAVRRIARGRLWCTSHGLRVRGFVAPAWLLSDGAWAALEQFDFEYTTTLTRFFALRTRQRVFAPSVVYSTRSGLRRTLSRGWNRALLAATTRASLVRVGLHPADALYPGVAHHAWKLLDKLACVREPMTKYAYAQQLNEARQTLRISDTERT